MSRKWWGHRLFLNWLRGNRSRLVLQPHILMCHKQAIEFTFLDITPALKFILHSIGRPRDAYYRISIESLWQGEEFDTMGWFDVAPVRMGEGWTCRLDRPEDCHFWKSQEQAVIEHCFEPFLAWCNTRLLSARWLELWKYGGMANSQFLESPPTDETSLKRFWEELSRVSETVVVPVHKSFADLVIVQGDGHRVSMHHYHPQYQ